MAEEINEDSNGLTHSGLLEGFDDRLEELHGMDAIVTPLKESVAVFLREQQALKGASLTMPEVIDHTVQFLRDRRDFLSSCFGRGLTMHDVIDQIAGTLWLHYTMKDYDYLEIDDDPDFTCSGEIEDALREKLEAAGLVERPN